VIATIPYKGPPLGPCGHPLITLADGENGSKLDFLTGTFDPQVSGIIITVSDQSKAVKGSYQLYAVFSKPGEFSLSIGVLLKIFDICDDSLFPSAPVLVPDQQDYYTNQGDLIVEATW